MNPIQQDRIARIIIDPETAADQALVAKWLSGGTARGLVLRDTTVLIADGYGNTHATMVSDFQLQRQWDWPFIIQTDGNISIEWGRNLKIEDLFKPKLAKWFRGLAKRRNNPELRILSYE